MEDMNDSTKDAGLAVARHDTARSNGGVQSIERAFDLLEMLADGDGALGLSELAAVSNGHQNSTAPNPAARAAAGRRRSGSSVNSSEQFAR